MILPAWDNLGKEIEVTDISGQNARAQLKRLQEHEGVIDEAALMPFPPGQIA